MMVKPSVAELLEKVDNRFRLVSVTSKRARQISEKRYEKVVAGEKPEEFEESPVTIAAQEIAEGKVREVKDGEEDEEEENEEDEEVAEEGKDEKEC